MTVRLSTTVGNIEKTVSNTENIETILRFFGFMKKIGTSERYQNNNLKAISAGAKVLSGDGPVLGRPSWPTARSFWTPLECSYSYKGPIRRGNEESTGRGVLSDVEINFH